MGKKNITETNEIMYDAKALVYLKYGGERIAPGQTFKVKESHVKELKDKNCAEIEEIKEAAASTNADGTTNLAETNDDNKDSEKAGA